jgi:hypothetical protein
MTTGVEVNITMSTQFKILKTEVIMRKGGKDSKPNIIMQWKAKHTQKGRDTLQ